jgi:hypothetical protein
MLETMCDIHLNSLEKGTIGKDVRQAEGAGEPVALRAKRGTPEQ